MCAFKLFTDEFSGWYLEIIKPAYQKPIDQATYSKTLEFFEILMKIIHPFMPFITEELWQHICERKDGESIMVDRLEVSQPTADEEQLWNSFNIAKDIIANVRAVRNQNNIPQKETLALQVVGQNPVASLDDVVKKMANLSSLTTVETKDNGTSSFLVGTTEYAVHIGNLINADEEIAKMEAEVKRLEGFLAGVMKKLSNERFVSSAPANVVELERKKQADAEAKIASLKENIKSMKG
jgi:valyl-tRNA synthetase